MPFKRSYKRKTPMRRKYTAKKRTYRKKRFSQSKRITTAAYIHKPLSANGLPNVLTTKLKYTSAFTLTTSAVGALSTYHWHLNSLFDPDSTGVGHQPYLYDQLKALYTNYLVIGTYCAIKLTPINYNQNMIITGVRVNDNTSAPPTSWDYLKEIGHTAFINLIAGANPRTYRRYVDIARAIGVQKQSYLTDPDYTAVPGSNPSTMCDLTVSYSSADGTTTPSFYVEASFTYTVKFATLITAAQS